MKRILAYSVMIFLCDSYSLEVATFYRLYLQLFWGHTGCAQGSLLAVGIHLGLPAPSLLCCRSRPELELNLAPQSDSQK